MKAGLLQIAVRAVSVEPKRHIAVMAKNAIAGWIALLFQNSIKFTTSRMQPSLCGATSINMIDTQKFQVHNATACAYRAPLAIIREDLTFQGAAFCWSALPCRAILDLSLTLWVRFVPFGYSAPVTRAASIGSASTASRVFAEIFKSVREYLLTNIASLCFHYPSPVKG